MPEIENTWRAPITLAQKDLKDIFIEELRDSFNENHWKFPNLPIVESFPDEPVEWKGIIIQLTDLKATPANIGDAIWWHYEIGEETIYRSDVFLFDGHVRITVGARGTLPRDEMVDSVMQILMFYHEFWENIRNRGVEFEPMHEWSGDDEYKMSDESEDFIYTSSTDIEVSGELYYTRDPMTGLIEAIIIRPVVADDCYDELRPYPVPTIETSV